MNRLHAVEWAGDRGEVLARVMYRRMFMREYLRRAALAEMREQTPSALPDLPDLYEPNRWSCSTSGAGSTCGTTPAAST
ncbi:hypothetical protein [Streptomyces virginiae]|uniref:hypothetical protein n=1 Tax=Streptomyces virginiae TaxID=1961 RepID=UPI00343C01DD